MFKFANSLIANLPEEVAEEAGKLIDAGIYYGWASVGFCKDVHPMVMSFGWNPYYKNERRSAVCTKMYESRCWRDED